MSEYGLDFKYFENVIKREFGGGLKNYTPDEFARVCLRMARTASEKTFCEPEFSSKIKADAIRECSEQSFIDDKLTYMLMQNRADKLERGEL